MGNVIWDRPKQSEMGLLKKVLKVEYGWSGSVWLFLECGHKIPTYPSIDKAIQRIGHRARCPSCLLAKRGYNRCQVVHP